VSTRLWTGSNSGTAGYIQGMMRGGAKNVTPIPQAEVSEQGTGPDAPVQHWASFERITVDIAGPFP
jgi:hypothetical protein